MALHILQELRAAGELEATLCRDLEQQAAQDALQAGVREAHHLREQADQVLTGGLVAGALGVASGGAMASLALGETSSPLCLAMGGSSSGKLFDTARQLGSLAEPASQLGEASGMGEAAGARLDRAAQQEAERRAEQWSQARQQVLSGLGAAQSEARELLRLSHEAVSQSIGR
jgi:hypothetical protein